MNKSFKSRSKKNIDLSIIIVNWNTKKLLHDCIDSIYKNTEKLNFEVIVVDNDSKDGSAEMVKKEFPQVKLIVNDDNLGFAKANNKGIKIAKGRYVSLLNSDTVVKRKAYKIMVEFMDNNLHIGAVGPKVISPDDSIQYGCARHFPTPLSEFYSMTNLSQWFPKSKIFGKQRLTYWDHKDSRYIDLLLGACMVIRKKTVDDIGLMDEDFFIYGDDAEYCFRIKKAGWRIFYLPKAEIIHYSGQSSKQDLTNMRYHLTKSYYIFFKKYYGTINALSYRIMVLLLYSVRTIFILPILILSNKSVYKKKFDIYLKLVKWSLEWYL